MGFAAQDDEQKDLAFDRAQAALDQRPEMSRRQSARRGRRAAGHAGLHSTRAASWYPVMTRGMLYTGRVHEALEAAKALDPQNPRVYLLLGNDLYFRPAIFGGGADKGQARSTKKPRPYLLPSSPPRPLAPPGARKT